jgi:hypothetical protein
VAEHTLSPQNQATTADRIQVQNLEPPVPSWRTQFPANGPEFAEQFDISCCVTTPPKQDGRSSRCDSWQTEATEQD